MIEVTRGFRRRFSSLKTTGCVISGPAILLLSTGIVDDSRTERFCQASQIGRGKLKLVDPVRWRRRWSWWRSIGTFFPRGGVIVVVVVDFVVAVVFSHYCNPLTMTIINRDG